MHDRYLTASLTAIPTPGAADPTGQARPSGQAGKDGKVSASRSDGLRAAMHTELASDDGKACYLAFASGLWPSGRR
jgi:hypothetical protein